MILVNVLLGFSQFFRAIPIMNPLPWFMIIVLNDVTNKSREHRLITKEQIATHANLILPLCTPVL